MKQEIILIMGCMASGKSSLARHFVDKGYVYLNRDKNGGKVNDLVPLMDKVLKEGKSVCVDNTHPTVKSRKEFLHTAIINKVNIHCLYMTTSTEDCLYNAASRMIERYGKILSPEELKNHKDPNMFPPGVIMNYKKMFEMPTVQEGFTSITEVKFDRLTNSKYNKKALFLDYDSTLRKTKSGAKFPTHPDDIEILPNRKEIIQKYVDQGYILLGVSNQSGVNKGDLSEEVARDCFNRTNELLGFNIDYMFCPHQSWPVSCYCRKPHLGNFILLQQKHKIDFNKSIFVGDYKTDEQAAKAAGIKYLHEMEFFK